MVEETVFRTTDKFSLVHISKAIIKMYLIGSIWCTLLDFKNPLLWVLLGTIVQLSYVH